MKKALVLLLALCLMIPVFCAAEGEEAAAEAPAALTADMASNLTVLASNVMFVKGFWSNNMIYLAKVRNDGDKLVCPDMDKMYMAVLDADGNEIARTSGFFDISCYPNSLAPGETAYVKLQVSVEGTPASVQGDLVFGENEWASPYQRIDATAEFTAPKDAGYSGTIRATVTNTLDTNLECSAAVLLTDADGLPLLMNNTTMLSEEIIPGSTIVFRLMADSDILDWCAANGITPAAVEAIAWRD